MTYFRLWRSLVVIVILLVFYIVENGCIIARKFVTNEGLSEIDPIQGPFQFSEVHELVTWMQDLDLVSNTSQFVTHSLLTHSNPVHFRCISQRVLVVECSFCKINSGSDSHIVVGVPGEAI